MALRCFWPESLSRRFSRDISSRESVAIHSVQNREGCLELARKCMEHVQSMTSPSALTPLQFNHGQCDYLRDKLEVAVQTAEEWARSYLPSYAGESIRILTLLWRSAKEVECFVQSCCKGNWIQAAMGLANVSEHVSQLSSKLYFCTLHLRCSGPRLRSNTLEDGWQALIEFESDVLTECELLRKRVLLDQNALLTKLGTVNHLNDQESLLAKYLSQRLSQYLTGSVQLSDWRIQYSNLRPGRRLGKGSAGLVRKSVWFGEEVAEKTFEGPPQLNFINEIKILAGLAHPNIVPLLGYAVDGNKCVIVMELMDGDLSSLMEERLREHPTRKFPFTVFEAVDMMLQTAEGMLYLHENNVVHRDLKSQNILVKSRNDIDAKYVFAKVADFGLSRTKESSTSYSNLTLNTGTTRWMAPELMIVGANDLSATTSIYAPKLSYPFKVDVYSFGMVCYEILTGELPFANISSCTVLRKMVLDGERPVFDGKHFDQLPQVLKQLIRLCWDAEASRRPSFVEICKGLRCLKWLLMRGSDSAIDAAQIGSDPEVFEAMRLTFNPEMVAIKRSTMNLDGHLENNQGHSQLLGKGTDFSSVTKTNQSDFQPLGKRTNFGYERDFNKKYTLEKILGHGVYSKTYSAIENTIGSRVAVKIIEKKQMIIPITVEDVKREVQILRTLTGKLSEQKSIVQFYAAFEDDDLVYIVMELCEGGELLDRILAKKDKRYTEKDAVKIVSQMLNIAAQCHVNGVVHRDLKPENFLFETSKEDSPLKVVDFGLSDFIKPGQRFRDVVGSAYYVAPEVLHRNSGPESDVWSIGVITYILLCGRRPFWAKSEAGIFNEVLKKKPEFREKPWPTISLAAKDFVQKLLVKDPHLRLTAAQALSHPWVHQARDDVLSNLRKFVKYSRLKQFAHRALASVLEPEEILFLRNEFDTMDAKKNGVLTMEEIRDAVRKDTPWTEKSHEELEIFQAVDCNANGVVEFDEFVAATLHVQLLQQIHPIKWQLRSIAAFSKIDIDGDGYINADDLKIVSNRAQGISRNIIERG
ncbi:hypothetical protein M758_1G022600 [Ceratodon purpureus]|nr:hypothetical protein M758_1G022600 [Ceratodon purpureus]